MRTAIDISTVLNFGTDIGSSRYIVNLVKAILKADRKNTYILFARHFHQEHFNVLEEIRRGHPSSLLEIKLFPSSPKKNQRWDRLSFPPLDWMGLRADVYHFPDYLLAPLLSRNRVLTIHDMSFYSVPQFNFPWFVAKYQKLVRKNAMRSKLIIADSRSTKEDIIRHLGIDPEKIHAIHLGADGLFRRLKKDETDPQELKALGIQKPFILSVGTIEPRKNYVTLIKAFNRIRQKTEACCVVCGKTGWKSEATFEEWEKSPYRKDILFAGPVSDSRLLQLYNQAELFFYPSYFEGFGLPVVEAMACGLPVVSSATSSILELVDDKTLLFDPEDIQGFSDKILAILSDKSLRKKLSSQSIENAKKFRFSKTAAETVQVYRKALES